MSTVKKIMHGRLSPRMVRVAEVGPYGIHLEVNDSRDAALPVTDFIGMDVVARRGPWIHVEMASRFSRMEGTMASFIEEARA